MIHYNLKTKFKKYEKNMNRRILIFQSQGHSVRFHKFCIFIITLLENISFI